ncbi:lipopolysaccharide biosynthesis protein [Rummeliibacillus sp. JY-2-4R]
MENLLKNRFTKNVLMLIGGTAFAQVIGIALSPVITRIYLPEEFGVLTVFISILGTISMLGSLSYESAVPIADDEIRAINVLSLSLIILFLISIFLSFTLYLVGDYSLQVLNATELINYQYFIVIGFFMTGLYAILDSWSLRMKNYKVIAKTKYSQSITGNGTKIILGLLKFDTSGLIFGQILGQSAGIFNMLIPILKNQKALLKSIRIKTICWCAKRYIRFPKYSAPTIFIISLTSQLPVYFLSAFYSPHTVGLYGLALTITFLPMNLIGKSVQDVFYGEAASLGKSKPSEIKSLADSLHKKLSLIGAGPMISLSIFGPQLFSIVFGGNWNNAGVFASALSIYAYTYFIYHPISTVFSIFEEQHLELFLHLSKIIIVIFIFFLANHWGLSSFYSTFMFSIAMGVTEFIKYLLAQYVINKHILLN